MSKSKRARAVKSPRKRQMLGDDTGSAHQVNTFDEQYRGRGTHTMSYQVLCTAPIVLHEKGIT
jgi:hypothetical protein